MSGVFQEACLVSEHARGWRFRVIRWPLPEGRDPRVDVAAVVGLAFRANLKVVELSPAEGIHRWVVGVLADGVYGDLGVPDGWDLAEVLGALGVG